jgi:hypothetical protein
MHSHPDIVAIGRWARVNSFALARWVAFSGPLVDPFGLCQWRRCDPMHLHYIIHLSVELLPSTLSSAITIREHTHTSHAMANALSAYLDFVGLYQARCTTVKHWWSQRTSFQCLDESYMGLEGEGTWHAHENGTRRIEANCCESRAGRQAWWGCVSFDAVLASGLSSLLHGGSIDGLMLFVAPVPAYPGRRAGRLGWVGASPFFSPSSGTWRVRATTCRAGRGVRRLAAATTACDLTCAVRGGGSIIVSVVSSLGDHSALARAGHLRNSGRACAAALPARHYGVGAKLFFNLRRWLVVWAGVPGLLSGPGLSDFLFISFLCSDFSAQ